MASYNRAQANTLKCMTSSLYAALDLGLASYHPEDFLPMVFGLLQTFWWENHSSGGRITVPVGESQFRWESHSSFGRITIPVEEPQFR
jgi:hypothetical protein